MRPNFIVSFLALLTAMSLGAAPDTPASRVEQAYQQARARYQAQSNSAAAAWQFGSACFDQCDFSSNDTDRARFANEGIAACRRAVSLDPKLAAAHYYLGMDLAQLARTKLLGALGLLREVEKEWKTAVKLDENFDYAGPDRNLGLLYLQAPGWPVSLGSRANAQQHLLRAVQLHPEYPENHLNLIEAYLKWNNRAESQQAAVALVKILPEARKKFTGPMWESSWDDWDKRWRAMQTKLNQSPGMAALHSRK